MKKLNSVFKGKEIPKSNNKEYCYVNNKSNVKKDIDNIFDSLGPIYKKRVIVKTRDDLFETYIIKRYEGFIKTIDNRIISENDIESIKRVN